MVGHGRRSGARRNVHRWMLRFSTRTRDDIGFVVVLIEDVSEPFFRACEIDASLVWMWGAEGT